MTDTQNAAPAPGSAFQTPGYTIPIFQRENTFDLGFTPSQNAQTNINSIQPMAKTDIVEYWKAHFTMDITNGGTTTPTPSPYAPYSLIGPLTLKSQNALTLIDIQNGIDLYTVNQVHPIYPKRNIGYGLTLPQAVQSSVPNQNDPTTSGYSGTIELDLPGGLWFESFLDMDPDGSVQGGPMPAFVSPQVMSGTKAIQLSVKTEPLIGQDFGSGLFYGGSSPTSSGSGTLDLYRRGYQAAAAPYLPLLFPVNRKIITIPFALGSQSKPIIEIPALGQIGWIGLRFYDPNSDTNSLTPPVSSLKLKVAGGVYRFVDTPATNQARLIEQHGPSLPQGTLGWDLWIDDHGRRNNYPGINTLATAAPTIEIEMSTALSSAATLLVTYDVLAWLGNG